MDKMYERINWQDEPSTATEIDAEHLNQMDKGIDDIDDRLISVNAKAEVVSDITDVTRNLWNKSDYINGYISGNTTIKLDKELQVMAYIKCKPNATYTIQHREGSRFRAAYTHENHIPKIGDAVYGYVSKSGGSTITIATDAEATYLVAWVWSKTYDPGISLDDMLATVQIEEGYIATDVISHYAPKSEIPIQIKNVLGLSLPKWEYGVIDASGHDSDSSYYKRARTVGYMSTDKSPNILVGEKNVRTYIVYYNSDYSFAERVYTDEKEITVNTSHPLYRVTVLEYEDSSHSSQAYVSPELIAENYTFYKKENSVSNDIDSRIDALEIATVNGIPNYFLEHLRGKMGAIQDLSVSCDSQFVFITDFHGNSVGVDEGNGNTYHSKALIESITQNCGIDKVFFGGDIVNGTYSMYYKNPSASHFRRVVRQNMNYLKFSSANTYFIAGNHDLGGQSASSANPATPIISVAELIQDVGIDKYNVTFGDNQLNYYVDDETAKVRYICIATNGLTIWGYPSSVSSGTKAFVKSSLEAMPNDYVAIVFNHMTFALSSFSIVSGAAEITKVMSDYNALNRGKAIALITGHVHYDCDTTSNGILVVGTTTASLNEESNKQTGEPALARTVGTVSEEAFDVISVDKANRKLHFTRIGAGSDREFNY